MTFANPMYLTALIIVPFAIFGLISKRHSDAVRYPDLQLLDKIKPTGRVRFAAWMPWFTVAALILMVIALARPQIGKRETLIPREGIDIILVIDVSSSMLTPDFDDGPEKLDRLQAVKTVAANFMKQRPNDRIGVVVFAGQPYILAPLTWDRDWIIARLDALNGESLTDDGTAIGAALAAASNRLRVSNVKSKVIILLTDGINNSGMVLPADAAKDARQYGIVLYTIGAGSQARIDEALMTKMAEMTGGRYFRAGDTQTLSQIFERINRMAKTSQSSPRYGEYLELYPYLLSVAFLLLFLGLILSRTLLRRIP